MQKLPVKKIEIAVVAAGAVVIAAVVFAFAFPRQAPVAPPGSDKLQVVTTLFPFYDFARQIGGDRADVTLLLPPGVDPHSFEPRPSDILKINRAGVFIYTGKYLEPWVAGVVGGLDPARTKVIDASAGITLLPADFHDADEPAGAPDPHLWLDFGNDVKIVRGIADYMGRQDPENAAYYDVNAAAYEQRLIALDAAFRGGLADCATREIIYGGHYALGYLAHNYGLEYFAAQGISPDAEPTAADLAALVDQIRKNGVKFVFYEELESPKIAQTIADEAGAKLLFMNAGHNVGREDLEKGTTFVDIMETDLANLKAGLQCR